LASDLNTIDLVALALACLSAIRGWRLGFIGQALELGGGFIGLLAGAALAPGVVSLFTEKDGLQAAMISLIVIFIGLSVGQAGGYLLGHRFGSIAMRARLGSVDSGLGAAFGAVLTLIAAWLIAAMLVQGPSRPIALAIARSKTIDYLNKLLPRPPDVLAYVRHYLNTSGFPQVFAGVPPPIGEPVKLPRSQVAQRAVAAAADSTMQIIVPACGGTQLGSGWVAAPGRVVTNAHVVAGGDDVTVADPSGTQHQATVVLFDSKTDIAVVAAEGLDAPALDLQTAPQGRGSDGATLGFPGGRGRLITHRAAVQASYEASGYDIYGRSRADRMVYELRAPVRQGDSGGPFVLPNGDVAGVVFAASTTHADTGYALTGEEISDEVQSGIARSQPSRTGRCVR
jgi:S1-C subfamily serine protease